MRDQMCNVFKRLAHVRETRRHHELVLEFGIGRQFKPFDLARYAVDLIALLNIQQRDPCAVALDWLLEDSIKSARTIKEDCTGEGGA